MGHGLYDPVANYNFPMGHGSYGTVQSMGDGEFISHGAWCHECNSNRSLNMPQGEEREAESGRQVNYLFVTCWPDQ